MKKAIVIAVVFMFLAIPAKADVLGLIQGNTELEKQQETNNALKSIDQKLSKIIQLLEKDK